MNNILQVRFNPGMKTWTRRTDGNFDFLHCAHGAGVRGVCKAIDVAMQARGGRRGDDEIIIELERLGWNEVLLYFYLVSISVKDGYYDQSTELASIFDI